MSDKANIFINTLLGVFKTAENRLLEQGLEKKSVENAMKELKELLGSVARKNLGSPHACHKYYVGKHFPILQRMAVQWYKQFSRRMSVRCKVLSPWKVNLQVNVPKELFSIIKDIVFETNYGLYYSETKSKPKKCVIAFTSAERVRNLFIRLMDTDLPSEQFLRRRFKGQRRLELIVSEDKQFGMMYNSEKELLYFDFHYGFWNEQGFPQHL